MLNTEQPSGPCSFDIDLSTLAMGFSDVTHYKYVIGVVGTEQTETQLVAASPQSEATTLRYSTELSCTQLEFHSFGVDSNGNDITPASEDRVVTTGMFLGNSRQLFRHNI